MAALHSGRTFEFRQAILLGTASVAALALAPAAFAQEAPDTATEEIVVTGYVRQNTLSVDEKRNRDYEADFLTNDETGQQPDYNVSDSLRRLPGVDTVFDEDEGRYVAIRGLDPDYTFGSLDGATLASSERANRRLNMEAIPTVAIKRSEVRKSRTPDMEGSAIGGAIDLASRSAYDSRGAYLVGNLYVGAYDSTSLQSFGDAPGYWGNNHAPGSNGISMRAAATFSTKFGAQDQFGVVVAGSFLRRQRDQIRYQPSGYTLRGDQLVPGTFNMVGYPLSSERWSAFGKLEYKPAENFYAQFAYARFEQNEREYRYLGNFYTRGAYTTDADGNSVSARGQAYANFNDFADDKPLTTYNASARWAPSDVSTLDVRASHSIAKFWEPTNNIRFITSNNNTNLSSTIDATGYTPILTITNPGYYANPANYTFSYYYPSLDNNIDKVSEGEINYGYNIGNGDTGFGFRTGAKFRRSDRVFDYTRYDYALAPGVTFNMQSVFGGTYNIHNVSAPVPAVDIEKFWDYVSDNPDNFVVTTNAASVANDYQMIEDVAAGYVSGSYKADRLSLIFGLRYEDTSTEMVRPSTVGDVTTIVSRTGHYGNWLPSVTGYYDIIENLRLRASYYKGVGRPNPNHLAAGERYTPAGTDDEDGLATVSRGNPELKARTADSFGIGLEYYFPQRGGIVSVSYFHKAVKNDIFTGRTNGTFNGEEVVFSQPMNMADANVDGVEFNFVKNRLEFLPGLLKDFGISANWTHMRGRATVVMSDDSLRTLDYMREQPRDLVNFSLFYKSGPFQARGTYAYKSRYLKGINLTPATGTTLDTYEYPYEQFDLQLRLKANDWVELIAEGRNLTDSYRNTFQDLDDPHIRDYNYTGRAFWVGASFKL
ncbi:TonB-dependent receptor [Sphingomonas sp. ACRSK]|uniref:TonB-dependent receptor n=1 Tax=Sphingomonas sp. ACRSK TaxID=2918213 RepID=UPI001EF513D8|nr:TonB-dependent receptor [Sphingomonas sp. ACRSK]MCG7349955.1 TonB-dependent receptor [Sphingomonas sp. ACRSK]